MKSGVKQIRIPDFAMLPPGFFGPIGMIAGAVAGGVKFKQAQTTLILADTRSGVQLAAAQSASEKADLAIGHKASWFFSKEK